MANADEIRRGHIGDAVQLLCFSEMTPFLGLIVDLFRRLIAAGTAADEWKEKLKLLLGYHVPRRGMFVLLAIGDFILNFEIKERGEVHEREFRLPAFLYMISDAADPRCLSDAWKALGGDDPDGKMLHCFGVPELDARIGKIGAQIEELLGGTSDKYTFILFEPDGALMFNKNKVGNWERTPLITTDKINQITIPKDTIIVSPRAIN